MSMSKNGRGLDVLVVGAGFAGIYALYRLRKLGFNVRGIEAGSGVGGTWFWNRYPGARCDTESLVYSFSSYAFPDELEQEWAWTERYPTQGEIERYMNHVVDRYDLRRLITFDTRMVSADYSEETSRWRVRTESGDILARYVVMAVGGYSVPVKPDIPGIGTFGGELYYTNLWPREPVDFSGKRVGLIGTGSSGAQVVSDLSTRDIEHLFVFHRTANFVVPARNMAIDPEREKEFKANYKEFRARQRGILRNSASGVSFSSGYMDGPVGPVAGLTYEQFASRMDEAFANGGSTAYTGVSDLYFSEAANRHFVRYLHDHVRSTVQDPQAVAALTSQDYPAGTRRIIVADGFLEAFGRDNTTLVDVKADPIREVTVEGIGTQNNFYPIDILICATGFDSSTGAFIRPHIVGRDGKTLHSHWAKGPKTYLGVMSHGFPNLYMITGPGSPGIRSYVLVSIEQHVEWIADLLVSARERGADAVEPTEAAETSWTQHVADVADKLIVTKYDPQYLGANVPGKPRVYTTYVGGMMQYRDICDQIAADGYEGLAFETEGSRSCSKPDWRGFEGSQKPPEGPVRMNVL